MHERCGVRTVDRASDRPIWRAYMHPQTTRDYMRAGDAQLLMLNMRSKSSRAILQCDDSHLRAPLCRLVSVCRKCHGQRVAKVGIR